MATDVEMGADRNPTLDEIVEAVADMRPVSGVVTLEIAVQRLGDLFGRGASLDDCQKVADEVCEEYLSRQPDVERECYMGGERLSGHGKRRRCAHCARPHDGSVATAMTPAEQLWWYCALQLSGRWPQ